MSDTAELWAAMRARSREKKQQNYLRGIEQLDAANISYTKLTDSLCRIKVDKGTVDYWPSTGLWIVRTAKPEFRGRGIRGLIFWLQRG